ncbi:MAG: hypothetical protein MRY77_06940 [Rhodobacteraceae bacterium]|nr:hypothetical protein [Paracoccaceae bacterium]
MTGETPTTPEKESVTLTLGCEPHILVTITETPEGNLFISLVPEAPSDEPYDLDGVFFNFTDDTMMDSVNFFPDENGGGIYSPVTDIQTDADNVDSLSNGAQLADTYDAGVQFGTVADSTEGTVNFANFTLWSDAGPLSIEDLDLSSFAVVVDSDTPDGMVLTVNDSPDAPGDGGTDPNPAECAFTIEGEVNTEVVLTQLDDGSIQVDMEVLQGDDPDATGSIGDIRGLFFNIGDETLLDDLSIDGEDVTSSQVEANSVLNLGSGANMVGDGRTGYDVGVEIGTSGQGGDDIQQTSFVLSHPDGLSLDDFSGEEFGLRLTSVGLEGAEDREGSLKLTGMCEDDPMEPPVCDDQYALGDVMSLLTMPSHDDGLLAAAEDPEAELLEA